MEEIPSFSEQPAQPLVDEYLKKECDKLNLEIQELLKESRLREQFSLTVLALVSAWVYNEKTTHPNNSTIINLVSYIPLLTVCIYGVSTLIIYNNINLIGSYLKEIEIHFLKNYKDNNFSFGWERFLTKKNKKRKFVIVTFFIWLLQFIIALITVFWFVHWK